MNWSENGLNHAMLWIIDITPDHESSQEDEILTIWHGRLLD